MALSTPTRETMGVRRAAEVLGVSESTVRNYKEQGVLSGVVDPVNGYRRLDVASVKALKDQRGRG